MLNLSIIMRSLTVVGIAGLLAGACAPTSQTPSTPEEPKGVTVLKEEPGQPGGKLAMVSNSAFGNPNDPHLVITATGRSYAMPVTNGLLKRDIYDPKGPITGELAKSWSVSPDGLSYTFKLQEGVKFQNVPPVGGREFVSEDAKYSLLRITADPSVVPEKNRARFQRKLDFGNIKSIEAPDKYTLLVNLKEPFAPFMDSMAYPGTVVLPREFVEKFGGGFILEGMIGTGPYIPMDYKNQQVATYRKNPDYWKKGLPYLDEITFLYYADTQAQMAAFRARQLDVSSQGAITKAILESLRRDMPDIKVHATNKAFIMNFRFNTKFPPFQDVRVRRAIHLALDRHQFLELIGEGYGVVSGPITPTFTELASTMEWLLSQPGYRKDKSQDIEEAKRLLKEAGYGDGLTLGLMISAGATTADAAALLQDQLKPLKITLKVDQVDYAGQWVPRSVNQEFDLSHMTHVMSTDGDSLLSAHIHSQGGRNYGKFSDPAIDDLIKRSRSTVAIEERREWAHEAEKLILERVPLVFIYNPAYITVTQPWVHNFGDGPISDQHLLTVEKAWVEKR